MLEGQSESEGNNKNTILQIKNLSKVYYRNNGNNRRQNNNHNNANEKTNIDDVEYRVLDNLNMDIKDGEFVAIVGPSGCGKSTFLNIIAGIDKDYTNGEILFSYSQGGSSLIDTTTTDSRLPDSSHLLNQDKILIFQEAALFPWLTLIENVEFGLKVAKFSKDKRKEIARRYIQMVQLSNFTDSYVHQLSGGMKQRVAIARALALNPKVLLMDEPFAALDVNTRNILQQELLRIHKATGKTILFVTHNINEAVTLADRVIVLSPKHANIKKQFAINLPHPRQLNHPMVDAITKEIVQEAKEEAKDEEFEVKGGESITELEGQGENLTVATV